MSEPTVISSPKAKVILKRRGEALSGGSLIISSIGFYVAWSTYILFYENKWSFYFLTPGEILHAVLSWYVGFIVGAAAGVILIRKIRKTLIYYITGAILFLSGILLLPAWETIAPIIGARYIGGIAHGIAFLTVVIHCSEISAAKNRGSALGTISAQIALSLAVAYYFMGIFGYTSSPMDFSVDQLYGIVTIIFSVLALICTKLKVSESPVFLIQHNNEQEALIVLAKFRDDSIYSESVKQEFQDLKAMIDEEKDETEWIFDSRNIRPLLRISTLRGLYSASTILVLTLYVIVYLSDLLTAAYSPAIVIMLQCITEAIITIFMDITGRRLLILLSSGICGILFFIVGCLFFSEMSTGTNTTIGIFLIVYAISLGMGLGPVSLTHMGEGFSIQKKPLSILFVVVVEHFVQILAILLVWWTPVNPKVLFLLLGVLQLAAGIFFYIVSPETKRLTLRQCKDIMK